MQSSPFGVYNTSNTVLIFLLGINDHIFLKISIEVFSLNEKSGYKALLFSLPAFGNRKVKHNLTDE